DPTLTAPRLEQPSDTPKQEEVQKESPQKDEPANKEEKSKDPAQKADKKRERLERWPAMQQELEEFRKRLEKLPSEVNPQQLQREFQKVIEEFQRQFQAGQNFFPDADFGKRFQDFNPNFGGFSFSRRGGSRLGVSVTKPSAALVDQLDLPKDQ